MAAADTPTRPRFPWIGLALCIACVGAAAWTWMRYSYAWDVTATHLSFYTSGDVGRDAKTAERLRAFEGRYVRLRGVWLHVHEGDLRVGEARSSGASAIAIAHLGTSSDLRPDESGHVTVYGRVCVDMATIMGLPAVVAWTDSTASRFHPASIAGLVVGAWGVFVFAAAFLHWRKRRRLQEEQAAEAT